MNNISTTAVIVELTIAFLIMMSKFWMIKINYRHTVAVAVASDLIMVVSFLVYNNYFG